PTPARSTTPRSGSSNRRKRRSAQKIWSSPKTSPRKRRRSLLSSPENNVAYRRCRFSGSRLLTRAEPLYTPTTFVEHPSKILTILGAGTGAAVAPCLLNVGQPLSSRDLREENNLPITLPVHHGGPKVGPPPAIFCAAVRGPAFL